MLLGADFIVNAFKRLTFLLDKGVYSLVQFAYSVFNHLANATILNADVVKNFTLRMYTLLGIIMVFVLAFNLLTYIVDPDKIADKKTGAASFVKDVLLAIIIISVSPMLFTKLYSLQSKVITGGVLENLILGGVTAGMTAEENWVNDGSKGNLADYYVKNGGNNMIASVYVAFLYPADGEFTALNCVSVKNGGENGEGGKYDAYCDAYRKVKEGYGLAAFDQFITDDDYNFTPLLTTVAGIVLLFFMLSFCINLAKRVGKMALIQLIAPIPVTLELLPNKKGLRENWLKTLGKVYIEVFFYLLVMFFIILLISLIPRTINTIFEGAGLAGTYDADGIFHPINAVGGVVTEVVKNGPTRLFATVLLIYGLLLFGKEAPQMLFDLLGIKSTGIIKEAALRGLHMAGSVTAGIGAATTGITRGFKNAGVGVYNAINNGKGFRAASGAFFGGLGGGITGAVGGLARGMYMNRAGGFKNIRATTSRAINETEVAAQRRAAARRNLLAGAENYKDSIDRASGAGGKAKAIFSPIGRSIANSGASRWADLSPYQQKKNLEATHREYKNIYSGIESIWKNDSKWQAYNAELMRAEALNDTDAITAINTKLDARKLEVLEKNKLKFMEEAGKLNNFIDMNQGVEGITANRFNLDDIVNIKDSDDAKEIFETIEKEVETNGFNKILNNLATDVPYQTERVKEKLEADKREAAKKAVDQKNASDNKK